MGSPVYTMSAMASHCASDEPDVEDAALTPRFPEARSTSQLERSTRRTVGIIGGMGPAATHAFFGQVIALTDARTDQEHIHLIIDNDPQIPDRTEFLLGRGDDPLPRLVAAARRLEAAGCELLVMPCNTAAAFTDQIGRTVSIPILDWTGAAADAAARTSRDAVGILATTGTIQAGLYRRALEDRGRRSIVPDPADQETVMAVIYGPNGVKSGSDTLDGATELLGVASRLAQRGAEAIVLACTELPIAVPAADPRWSVPTIDPSLIVAEQVVLEAGGRLRT